MIVGNLKQQKILRDLLENLTQGSILVYGPEGVGKLSFIKELLEEKEWEKIIIDNQSKYYQIETARTLTSLSQKKSQKRVIIINDFHKFQREAQNTLLKTFEEMISSTLFISITHQLSKILTTLRSRSILVKFNLVEKEVIINLLKKKGFDDEKIKLALNFYSHQPGKAINLLENKNKLEIFFRFIKSRPESKLRLVEKIKENFNLQDFLFYYLTEKQIRLRKKKNLTKSEIIKLRQLLNLYFDSDYYLNSEMQLVNLILNYES